MEAECAFWRERDFDQIDQLGAVFTAEDDRRSVLGAGGDEGDLAGETLPDAVDCHCYGVIDAYRGDHPFRKESPYLYPCRGEKRYDRFAGGNPFAVPVQCVVDYGCFRAFAAFLRKLPLRPCQNRFQSPDICFCSGNLVAARSETCRLKFGFDPGNEL